MNRNVDGSIDKKPVQHYNSSQPRQQMAPPLPDVNFSIKELNISQQQNSIQQPSNNMFDFSIQSMEPLASHVDAVIMDNSFKK